MSTTANIVLPQLGSWAQGHLQSILQAKSEHDFNTAFDDFVAQDVLEIVFNGHRVSREDYKSKLRGAAFDEVGAVVTFNGVVTIPGKGLDGQGTSPYVGEAGLFYTADIAEGIVIHDAAVERKVTSSINIFVKNDPSIPKPFGGFYDPRRVFKVNQVMTDVAANDAA